MSVILNNSYIDIIKPKSETIKTDKIIGWLAGRESYYYRIATNNDGADIDIVNRAKSAAYREVIEHILQ